MGGYRHLTNGEGKVKGKGDHVGLQALYTRLATEF